jgi:rhamnulokinase
VADLASERLLTGKGTMPVRLSRYFRATSQNFEYSRKNIVSAILRSIILTASRNIKELEVYSGMPFDKVYLTGGGSRITVFCQWLADCSGKEVISGIPESTINGNVIAQLIAMGELKDIGQGRDLVRESFRLKRYRPSREPAVDWQRSD